MKCGTQDLGTGTRTVVAIVTAETLGLPVSAVHPEIGDTNYPVSGGSGGSTTAASISPALRLTAGKALDALAQRVAPHLGVEPPRSRPRTAACTSPGIHPRAWLGKTPAS